MQKCIFLSLSWCYKLSDQKTNTLQSFSYLAELPKRPKQKKSCSKNWLIGQLCVKTWVHTNFVDIDLFYPLLILHAKNVKLQWKFAKFLSNQFVLQLPFFFVITYNFAFLRSYSRYSKALRCTFFGERKNLCSSKSLQLLLLNRLKVKWSKNRVPQGFHYINPFISNFFGPSQKRSPARSVQLEAVYLETLRYMVSNWYI